MRLFLVNCIQFSCAGWWCYV